MVTASLAGTEGVSQGQGPPSLPRPVLSSPSETNGHLMSPTAEDAAQTDPTIGRKHDPVVGVLFHRDKHLAAKSLADFTNPGLLAQVLCDEHMPLSAALSKQWDHDAHLLLYHVKDEDGDVAYARVSKRSPLPAELIQRSGAVNVTILALDHDLPRSSPSSAAVPGGKATWSEEGLGEFLQGLTQADLPSPTYWYTTLHGCRFVYVLTHPITHLLAEGMARALIATFATAGIVLDPACTDWTRLFRLPYAVREDTHERYNSLLVDGGPLLDPSTIEAVEAPAVAIAQVRPYSAPMPGPDDVRALLTRRGENGREYPSKWAAAAKVYLKGRESFLVCFEDAPIDVAEGWNNSVVKLVGQITGMTAQLDEASPEGIFALLYGALEQLQVAEIESANETDWFATTWDIVCRMWANEQAQLIAKLQERELALVEAKAVRAEVLEKIRAEFPETTPKDATEADIWLKRRMIASDGRSHYVMRADGSYNISAVSDTMLPAMIRELGMEDVIEVMELRGKSWVQASTQTILNEHATPVISVHSSARERMAHIDGRQGYRKLFIPVHRLNPNLVPVYSANVDEWLQHFFGEKYALGIEWLSWALEVNAPICALNLYGAPGTGKGMLVQGLAECFEGEQMNDSRVLATRFNLGLLYSPIVNCDEGLPRVAMEGATSVDMAFRSLVSGGNIIVEGKGSNTINANIYPRIVFTSNDPDILRSILGNRDLTEDDIQAIELRLLSIEIDFAARLHLTNLGNYRHTAGWIHGKDRSRYELANHIKYLYDNRTTSAENSGRLLVEGERQTALVRSMRMRTAGAQSILKAIIKLVESPSYRPGVWVDHGHIWITVLGITEYIDSLMTGFADRVSLRKALSVLEQLSTKAPIVRPTNMPHGVWKELDVAIILEEGMRYGFVCQRMEKLLREQAGGDLKADAIIRKHEEQQ